MARIMVVDDEPDMIWAITNVLLSEKHSVIPVNSGEEALTKLRQETIDLVLLDIRLPGMDGIQILDRIKRINPQLPVIMVSGYGGIDEAVEAIKLGAAHYIAKPFNNDHLAETVNKSLRIENLKKEGMFARRVAEKISAASPDPAQQSASHRPVQKIPWWIYAAAIAGLAGLAALAARIHFREIPSASLKSYPVSQSKISGLAWDGKTLWSADWFVQSIQRYEETHAGLAPVHAYKLPGYHFTGIALGPEGLYTCDSWKKMIFKHSPGQPDKIEASFPSPGPNPSGLFHDGKYLWSSDGNTRKIYQHVADERLTVIAAYETQAAFPMGLYHDGTHFWIASATGRKIFKHNPAAQFRLEATFLLPATLQLPETISGFTMRGNEVWLTFEGITKIFKVNRKDLQKSE